MTPAERNKKSKENQIRRLGSRKAYNLKQNTTHRAKRRILKERTHGFCVICRHKFPRIELTIDHKIAIANGGTNEKRNLQVICKGCHDNKTREENKARSKLTNPKQHL